MKTVWKQIDEQVSIDDIVKRYYNGKIYHNNKIPCFLHNEKDPSMVIFKKTNTVHCFGCQETVDSVDFVSKYLGISKLEAAKLIIKDFGLNISIKEFAKYTNEEKKAYREIQNKLKKEKLLRQQIESVIDQTYNKYTKIFKKTREYLLENNNNDDKLTKEYKFMLFLNTFSDKVLCKFDSIDTYTNEGLHNKIEFLLTIDKSLKQGWKRTQSLLFDEIRNQKL